MNEIQLLTYIANGGAIAFAVWLVFDTRREAQRREEAQRAEAQRREDVLRTEARAREIELHALIAGCSDKLERIGSVLGRLERWLESTE